MAKVTHHLIKEYSSDSFISQLHCITFCEIIFA